MIPWRDRVRKMVRRRRAALIAKLGGKCAACGSEEDLEFDHPNGRDWGVPSRQASHMRMKLYEEDYKRGVLRLLCSDCNKRLRPVRDDVPF